ncbi:MAG: DUF4159 domain-containing protein [Flavobacteriales bacterium]
MRFSILIITLGILSLSFAQGKQYNYQFAVLKYSGGGDWYANPTSVPNLVKFCNQNLGMNINPEVANVEVGSIELYNYPFVHMTGHGNVVFSYSDADNLRNYLIGGGFLHIDDNYGMDKFIRTELKKVFPELNLIEIPHNHAIYKVPYKFPNGIPKIHEHDGKPAQGFGLIYEGRIIVYYSYETDLGDGWEDPEVHNNPPEKRQQALKMGANLVRYALMGDNGVN